MRNHNHPDSRTAPDQLRTFAKPRPRALAGVTLIQVIVAMALVALCGSAGTFSLIQLNKKAASMRTMNNARSVVQRYMDTAMGVPFTRTVIPPILAITSATGVVYDEEGDGDSLVGLTLAHVGNTQTQKATLTRIVTAEANSDGADIRRITFRIDYTYGTKARPFTFEITSMRSSD